MAVSFIPVREVIETVTALGLRCTYDGAYMEFKIDYKRNDPRWNEDTAYFTTYRDDAVETAKVMAAWGTK